MTANEEKGYPLPEGMTTLGGQTREDYEKLVGGVKAVVGIGAPLISPSVYTALCVAYDPLFPLAPPLLPSITSPLPISPSALRSTPPSHVPLSPLLPTPTRPDSPCVLGTTLTPSCQATPVVVPYFVQNFRTDGWHLYSGFAQHGPASMIGEPYVYSYYSKNYTSLKDAIDRAVATPIER
jgi:hypothetical protein